MTYKSKTITQAQITGEHGVALVKDRVHAMGFLFTPYGPVEAGIDALIEIRDSTTGHVGGRFVAVQIKTRDDRAYDAETNAGFDYLWALWYFPECKNDVLSTGYVKPVNATTF
jgi:hypothetical protein